ncbi:hypothetical protein HYPSUDRAFT_53493 [Hypholoma sublateritium FD-334 SS-4]|uniref:Uncharacterized protein n=1 Tax=Hypholoma sublateritium (strain FD-334 SS-4) TaxID=945553 RepID=A0A0D2P220_HYPSF|nr:hypothetical protein HYPSUDRAFT_53493 [Hypholoma sublateritium FD-334 SS-4]
MSVWAWTVGASGLAQPPLDSQKSVAVQSAVSAHGPVKSGIVFRGVQVSPVKKLETIRFTNMVLINDLKEHCIKAEQEITGEGLLKLDISLLKSEIGTTAFGKRVRVANAIADPRRLPSVEYNNQPPGEPAPTTSMHSQVSQSPGFPKNANLKKCYVRLLRTLPRHMRSQRTELIVLVMSVLREHFRGACVLHERNVQYWGFAFVENACDAGAFSTNGTQMRVP